MATTDHLITPPGLTRVGLAPPPKNLFLHCNVWQAACPGCGYVLCESRSQARAERLAAAVTCPICQGGA